MKFVQLMFFLFLEISSMDLKQRTNLSFYGSFLGKMKILFENRFMREDKIYQNFQLRLQKNEKIKINKEDIDEIKKVLGEIEDLKVNLKNTEIINEFEKVKQYFINRLNIKEGNFKKINKKEEKQEKGSLYKSFDEFLCCYLNFPFQVKKSQNEYLIKQLKSEEGNTNNFFTKIFNLFCVKRNCLKRNKNEFIQVDIEYLKKKFKVALDFNAQDKNENEKESIFNKFFGINDPRNFFGNKSSFEKELFFIIEDKIGNLKALFYFPMNLPTVSKKGYEEPVQFEFDVKISIFFLDLNYFKEIKEIKFFEILLKTLELNSKFPLLRTPTLKHLDFQKYIEERFDFKKYKKFEDRKVELSFFDYEINYLNQVERKNINDLDFKKIIKNPSRSIRSFYELEQLGKKYYCENIESVRFNLNKHVLRSLNSYELNDLKNSFFCQKLSIFKKNKNNEIIKNLGKNEFLKKLYLLFIINEKYKLNNKYLLFNIFEFIRD